MEKRHYFFIRTIVSLGSVQQNLADRFFAQKFLTGFQNFIESYVNLEIFKKEGIGNVAQYIKENINSINYLLGLLEELVYLKIGKPTPLLLAQDHLLRYKLETLKHKRPEPQVKVKKLNSKSISKTQSHNVTQTAEKILIFIRNSEKVRAKEIIDEFNLMSGRTVKRMLKNLVGQGLIRKESKDRAMYYSAN